METGISVITICFNNLSDLVRTCRSVDEQSCLPNEHLIIDGSTNKEIFDWLTETPQPPYRRWIHERDSGISDAFNKGILNCRFPITHLLNSGDQYADQHALKKVLELFSKQSELNWVHSKYIQHRGAIDLVSGVRFDANQLWKGMRTVAHPGMFIKKEVYDRYGLYDTNLKIAMDYDFLVRIRKEKNAFIPEPLVYFAPGGASNIHFAKGLKEVRNSHEKYIGKDFRQTLWQLRQKILNVFMSTSLGQKWFQWKNKRRASR